MIIIIGIGEWHNLLRLYGSTVRPVKDNGKLSAIRERQRHGLIRRFGQGKQVLHRQARYPAGLAIARKHNRKPGSETRGQAFILDVSDNETRGQVFILDVSDNWGQVFILDVSDNWGQVFILDVSDNWGQVFLIDSIQDSRPDPCFFDPCFLTPAFDPCFLPAFWR